MPTDMAVPLALIVNELVTNDVKHVGPSCDITLRGSTGPGLKLTVSDKGQGPRPDRSKPRLGTRIVDAFTTQLGAQVETRQRSSSYTIELSVPLPAPR